MDFYDVLLKMSLQGCVIIAIILLVRFILKKLHISHKYLVGLWFIVFFYLVFPWKISLPVGFWDFQTSVFKEETATSDEENVSIDDTIDFIMADQSSGESKYGGEAPSYIYEEPYTTKSPVLKDDVNSEPADATAEEESISELLIGLFKVIMPYIWVGVLFILLLRLLISYFGMKRKLMLCIPYEENIWWAENIDTPMVFGLFKAKIYLPISLQEEDLTYIIAHEEVHIRRRDYFIKMIAYVICLIHWFNPLVWLAYKMLGNDMEKACDEEVLRTLGEEQKKEYAYALIHFISGEQAKKKIFVAPIRFDEGNIKARIQNIMKYQYTLPRVGTVVVVLCVVLSGLFLTKMEAKELDPETGTDSVNEEQTICFYVEDMETLEIDDHFSIEDYYITNRYTSAKHYYIDENGTLWKANTYDDELFQIAEHVVSVDAASWDNFCIYLTESHDLYMIEFDDENMSDPVLIMSDVAYARAGRDSVVILKQDKTAYFWGLYAVNYETPNKMYAEEPMKIMDNCRYITTGNKTGAAISEDGELYTWGYNFYGQCGTEITEEEYILTPVKVMDDVKMVWIDKIYFNDSVKEVASFDPARYNYNTFVLTNDGILMAAGEDAGAGFFEEVRVIEYSENMK